MYRPRTQQQAKRVSNREMRRLAQRAISAGNEAVLILIAVLAQQGGEVTVTQGTIDQCTKALDRLSFEVKPSAVPKEFVVRLLEGEGDDGEDVQPRGRSDSGSAGPDKGVTEDSGGTQESDDVRDGVDAAHEASGAGAETVVSE